MGNFPDNFYIKTTTALSKRDCKEFFLMKFSELPFWGNDAIITWSSDTGTLSISKKVGNTYQQAVFWRYQTDNLPILNIFTDSDLGNEFFRSCADSLVQWFYENIPDAEYVVHTSDFHIESMADLADIVENRRFDKFEDEDGWGCIMQVYSEDFIYPLPKAEKEKWEVVSMDSLEKELMHTLEAYFEAVKNKDAQKTLDFMYDRLWDFVNKDLMLSFLAKDDKNEENYDTRVEEMGVKQVGRSFEKGEMIYIPIQYYTRISSKHIPNFESTGELIAIRDPAFRGWKLLKNDSTMATKILPPELWNKEFP